jgi:hypothetical protein
MFSARYLIIIIYLLFQFIYITFSEIPKTLDECNTNLDTILDKMEIENIRNMKEDSLITLHFGLGLYIRNNWIRGNSKNELIEYFEKKEIFHPDDISFIIINNYWHYLHHLTYNLENDIARVKKNWQEIIINDVENKINQENTENYLKDKMIEIEFINKDVPFIQFPSRKNDPLEFCNDIIQYKDGFIINSISTQPGVDIEVDYNFFYFDFNRNILYKISTSEFDLIESIIIHNEVLYASGKKNGKTHIIQYKDLVVKKIPNTIHNTKNEIGKDSWVKLAIFDTELFAFEKNKLSVLKENRWLPKVEFNIDSFLVSNKCEIRESVIPTENIRIQDKLYFIQEILQGRDCLLLSLDIKSNNGLSEIFTKYNLKDNYQKIIDNYYLTTDNSVLITGTCIGENMLLEEINNDLKVYIYQEKFKSKLFNDIQITPKLAFKEDSVICLICDNGIFKIENNKLIPILRYQIIEELIPTGDGHFYHFTFQPRSLIKISENKYIIGGLYGGIYLFDLKNYSIECLDDFKYPIKKIDIFKN